MAHAKIRVLVVDDSEERRESLRTLFLEDPDIECIDVLTDGSEVVQQASVLHPDLILMDIKMPKVDGIEATKQLKKELPQVRVIIQTVYDDDDRIFNSLKAGAEGYILKSAPISKIRQSIIDVHHGGAVMTPSIAIRVMNYFNVPKASPEQQHVQALLSSRELEVLSLLTDGLSYKAIASRLGISYFTVNAHLRNIYEKLSVNSKSEAVSYALKHKIV